MNQPVHVLARPGRWPLYGATASRRIEQAAASALPAHTLMQRAGLAVARLALAIAPHAQRIWVAAGPGNNGGDGFEAAMHLHAAGRRVVVTALCDPARLPADAQASLARAHSAGVVFEEAWPDEADLVIDALLGLGAARAPAGRLADAIESINRRPCPRLAVDLPSGLAADTGVCAGTAVAATHTLALLTLKPGLFTGEGRSHSGELWFDTLDVDAANLVAAPDAWLGDTDAMQRLRPARGHGGHKGRYGDVVAIGGAPGMGGALVLAARAALIGGAGRVFACALDASMPSFDALMPELMWRPRLWQDDPGQLDVSTVVAGCGGGGAVRECLPVLLARSVRLVLDADALNAIAADSALQRQLVARVTRGASSVLTPHPLEAARLLGEADGGAVQADRLVAAQRLAERFACTVLLKGSGSVIAAPRQLPVINPSGNARLASAGTGDVLAGWLGGLWSAAASRWPSTSGFEVAQAAAFSHGQAAQAGDASMALPASALIERLAAPLLSGRCEPDR